MTPVPTGRLIRADTGSDLVLTRTFRALVEDVWASLTEPERTAGWFGRWEGDAAPGRTIRVQMAFEEEQPWGDLRIDTCDPPKRLAVSMVDEAGAWRMELVLTEADGSTELQLIHHLDTHDGLGEIGPGWEYYLDMFAAARDGSAPPEFDDYYPALKPYFDDLVES